MVTRRTFRHEARLGVAVAVFAAVVGLAALPVRGADDQPLTDQQKIIHVLNRLGYGPRPGDVERVQKMGLQKYLVQQLHPETIDDSALRADLAKFDILTMDTSELSSTFRDEQDANKQRQIKKAEAEKKNGTTDNSGGSSTNQTQPQPLPNRRPNGDPPRRSLIAVAELQNAKIISAIESPRQLYEVLVDFWSNHFNIDVRKGPCRVLKIADEREVIRPHVFGKFRDLLEASAKSPAMLHYLDNFQNSASRENPPNNARKSGINENYAREIMELHTLGVDGGYSQKDVQEVARCFTGWTVDPETSEFIFAPRRHDNGPKVVLGHAIDANGGIRDGERVLDILASHPSTAKFIATKLCRRFVVDDPPPALVDRVAGVFLQTDGDLRRVVQAIVYSPEFFSPQAYRAKIKSPFEFAVSAVRATGGKIVSDDTLPLPMDKRLAIEAGATFGRGTERITSAKRKSLNIEIIEMGQPLFAYQAPTGYPEDSRKWVNTGALIARMNFALALAEGNVVDISIAHPDLARGTDIDKPEAILNRLNHVLLQDELSASTRATLEKQVADKGDQQASTVNEPQLTALILGSPEFQRH